MCVCCIPGFADAMRAISFPSRRKFLRGAGAVAAASPFIAEAIGPNAARADGGINATLAKGLPGGPAEAAGPATIFAAKKIVTMERRAPTATAVAVSGKRIVAVGSLERVKSALGDRPYVVDETFKSKVVLPGFIEQHLHPFLGALTLTSAVIAPEDWVLPGKTFKAASSEAEFRDRLKAAEARSKDPNEALLSWGYHPLWHGKLDRNVLDGISATRPIAVWHRSAHEFYLNSAGLKTLGVTEAMTTGKGLASQQVNWAEGHFWENGLTLIAVPLLQVFATPERLSLGLKQMIAYLHANGVTAYNEPGAIYTPDMWKIYEAILGAPDTPLYSTFLVSGYSILDQVGYGRAIGATEAQIATAPENSGKKVMFFAQQIKLFVDGAVISEAMQMKDGYTDGHNGAWIMPPEDLEKAAKLYWDARYRLHFHVTGDFGLEVVLDVIERRLRENPRPDHRTVVVHFACSSEQQVARIRRLGAIVSANPYYPCAFADKFGQFGLGRERADAMVRARSVLRNDIPLSYHSDLPMGPSDPLYLAWCGVNRITPSGRVVAPEQRITVEEALRAITIGAAYSWRKEHELGSIAPGKIANLTVLDEDPYAVAPVKLKDVPVWGTVFEGRVFPVPEGSKRG